MTASKNSGLRARPGVLRLMFAGLLLMALGVLTVRAEGPKADVKIDNFTFAPNALTIRKGTEVIWTNNDDIPHTIVAIGSSLRSKTIDTDRTFSYLFDKTGTFNYICGLHPHMKGKIVVTE